MYDVDNDGYITREEMYDIVGAIYEMVGNTFPTTTHVKSSASSSTTSPTNKQTTTTGNSESEKRTSDSAKTNNNNNQDQSKPTDGNAKIDLTPTERVDRIFELLDLVSLSSYIYINDIRHNK